mgnify:CR=1 FL=1
MAVITLLDNWTTTQLIKLLGGYEYIWLSIFVAGLITTLTYGTIINMQYAYKLRMYYKVKELPPLGKSILLDIRDTIIADTVTRLIPIWASIYLLKSPVVMIAWLTGTYLLLLSLKRYQEYTGEELVLASIWFLTLVMEYLFVIPLLGLILAYAIAVGLGIIVSAYLEYIVHYYVGTLNNVACY